MSDQKTLSIGTIKEKTIEPKNGGDAFTLLEIDLKQNVEIYVGGEKVNFSEYEFNNKTFGNKRISITPVEISLDRMAKSVEDNKLTQEMANDISDRYEKQNVRYTLSIAPRNLA